MSRSREKELLGGATKSGGQLELAYLIRGRLSGQHGHKNGDYKHCWTSIRQIVCSSLRLVALLTKPQPTGIPGAKVLYGNSSIDQVL